MKARPPPVKAEDENDHPNNEGSPSDSESDEAIEESNQDATSGERKTQVVTSPVTSSPETPKSSPGDLAEKPSPSSGRQRKSDPKTGSNGKICKDQQTAGSQPTGDGQSTGGSWTLKRMGTIAGVAVASSLVALVAAPVGLSLAGFGAGGVVAGSFAAVWQAAIGNVATGSFFAALQSAGAAGLATSTVVAVGAAGATGGAVLAGVATSQMKPKAPKGGSGPPDDDDENNSAAGGAIVPSSKKHL